MCKPKQQGQLDGLCGIYAVVNAFRKCGVPDKRSKKLFKEAARALRCDVWPETLWDGTTFRELRNMIRACHEEVARTSSIVVEYPYLKETKPESDQAFHKKCLELIAEDDVRCLILGLKKREHWVVATGDPESRRVLHLDSERTAPARQNTPQGQATKTVYSRKQLVVFRKEK